MTPWYAPTNFKESIGRLMALRSALILSALCALLATEFRFDWIESAVGAYLVSSNHLRPESGTVWDLGHKTDMARKSISQYMDQRSGLQREARRATSMGQVVDGIDDERGAMISADHFVALYQKLPPVLSHEIISPYLLLTHLSRNQWKRVFFEKQADDQILIYLLDDHNQVLQRLAVGPVLIEHIQRGEVAIQTRLDQLGDFADHIYPAEQFFSTLDMMPDEVKQGVLNSPRNLLVVSGRIVRVGISSQTITDSVDIGFEVEDAQGSKVILTQGLAAHVHQLLWVLQQQA
ncbi:MAG: hypothetical protein PVH22_06670, partial [Desulfobacteraceae bacterium]